MPLAVAESSGDTPDTIAFDDAVEQGKVKLFVSDDHTPLEICELSTGECFGDTAVIGAFGDDDNGRFSGSAYVFHFDGTDWTEQVKLLASDRDSYDYFGNSVALDGDTAVIGALDKDDGGAAYVFALAPVAMDPVATDDGPYVLDEGGELVEDVNILDNDSNPDDDPLTPVVVDPPAHASFFQVMPDGTLDYTHDGSETTSDSFTYRASDGVNESEIATVSLEITPVNDAPTVTTDTTPLSYTETGTFDEPVIFAGESYDSGVPTEATYQFNSWRISYRYKFKDGDRWQLWVGFTAKIRDAKIELRQGETTSKDDDFGFVPLLHFAADYRFADRFLVGVLSAISRFLVGAVVVLLH